MLGSGDAAAERAGALHTDDEGRVSERLDPSLQNVDIGRSSGG